MAFLTKIEQKQCRTCGVTKTASEFDKCSAIKDGLTLYCKVCLKIKREPLKEKARARTKEWSARNPTANRDRSRDWHNANREAANTRRQQWSGDHPDRVIKSSLDYYEKNADRIRERARRYAKENPDVPRQSAKNRRAAIRGAKGRVTTKETAALLISQNHKCANPFCRADLRVVKKNLDHWMPIKLGGQHRIDNLRWMCEPCNKRKNAKHPDVWLSRLVQNAVH